MFLKERGGPKGSWALVTGISIEPASTTKYNSIIVSIAITSIFHKNKTTHAAVGIEAAAALLPYCLQSPSDSRNLQHCPQMMMLQWKLTKRKKKAQGTCAKIHELTS